MDILLQKSYTRKTFFSLTSLIILLAIILRFYTIPYFSNNPISIETSLLIFLDNFVSSLIVTVFIAIFIFWITPKIVQKSMMDIVHPKEISELLNKASIDSKIWYFKGVAGRYTRGVTLPTMAENANKNNESRTITLCLINPNNNKLCTQYANYRNSVASANPNSPWTIDRVRNESIATIISALLIQHEEPLLKINIYLLEHFSSFRVNISDKYVVITKEDKQASALRADKDTYFYDSYIHDIELHKLQAIEVTNKTNRILFTKENVTKLQLINFINSLEILNDDNMDKLDLNNIINSIQKLSNPYA